MQNRYAGDVGDFGKFGLLRQLANSGLRIGINWYLTQDESHNDDGKHIGYLSDPEFDGCDDELRKSLSLVVNSQRSVSALESMNLMPNAMYYHEVLHSPSPAFSRGAWHGTALERLKNAEVVFLDPDNGMRVKSVPPGSKKSRKYVFSSEIADYFSAGKSVIIYNHRAREREDIYSKRFSWMYEDLLLKDAMISGVSFRRGTVRDFIFASQPSHAEKISGCLECMLRTPWGEHFTNLSLSR